MLPDLHCSNEQKQKQPETCLCRSSQQASCTLVFTSSSSSSSSSSSGCDNAWILWKFFSDCLWASLLFINLSALIVTHSLGCQCWSHALLFTHSFFGTLTEIPSERWNAPSSNILKHPQTSSEREWPSSAKRRACTCLVHTVTGEILHCKGYCSQSMWVTCTLCTWS